LAILNSETLLGKEIKGALRGRRELASEVRLLTTVSDDIGTVTEGVDGAGFVQELNDESLAGADIVIVCPGQAPAGNEWIPSGATLLYAAPPDELVNGTVLVSGVNLHRAQTGAVLVSPHPAIVALALLLDPLQQFGLEQAACWALLPASIRGHEGIDELLDQTRSVLSFQGDYPRRIFGHQLAFNLLPSGSSSAALAGELSTVLDTDICSSLQMVQAGVFHSIAAGAQVRLANPPTTAELTEELVSGPFFSIPDEPNTVGPVVASGRSSLVLGPVEDSPGVPGGLTLWAAMDNLTVGGAGNVLGILEALVAPRH
jgi:aspartate-semialdehyde dehydrogenase